MATNEEIQIAVAEGRAIFDGAGSVARHDYRRPRGECAYCDEYGGEAMMPSHTPSDRCESGKRPHCTCDICF